MEMSGKTKGTTHTADYVYRGDKQTSDAVRGEHCSAVRRHDGKCIRGKNGSMLVSFQGKKTVVIGRLLKKIQPPLAKPVLKPSNQKMSSSSKF
jgi:hypothetical protein